MVVYGLGDAFNSGREQTGLPPLALSACVLLVLEFLRWRQLPRHIPGMGALRSILRLTVAVLLLDTVVGTLVLPAPFITNSMTPEELRISNSWQQENVMTGDGKAELHLGVLDRGFFDWVVMANPNGVRFEQLRDFLTEYSKATKRNVLAFNYRGVGESTGNAEAASDLLDDGRAAAAWLFKHRRPKPERVLFHGWSLGGPVALHLKSQYPTSCVVNDRSFSSLAAVGQHMFGANQGVFGAVVGAALMAAGAAVVPGTSGAVGVGAAVVSGLMGASGVLTPMVPMLLEALHWEMDAVVEWNNANCATDRRCIVLYHENDGIIDWQSASLHAAVVGAGAKSSGDGAQLVRLNHTFANGASNHMFAFPSPAAVHWDGLLHAIDSACVVE